VTKDDDDEQPIRQPLTRRRIVLAALALVEKHGLDALTMRRVATELQVTPMSLYNHVSDKAELVDLMVDFIVGDIVAGSAGDRGDWTALIRSSARRTYDIWRAHSGFARVYSLGVTVGPYGLTNVERSLGILREAGFSDRDAARAFFLLYRYVISSLVVAPARPVGLNDRASRSDGSGEDRISKYFSALPADQIPNVVASAEFMSGDDFDFGLDIVMAGLESRLAATKAASTAKVRRSRRA
jgi:AcrR family transcriptional regulator